MNFSDHVTTPTSKYSSKHNNNKKLAQKPICHSVNLSYREICQQCLKVVWSVQDFWRSAVVNEILKRDQVKRKSIEQYFPLKPPFTMLYKVV